MNQDVWIKTIGIYDGTTEEEDKKRELLGLDKQENVFEELPCFIKLSDIIETNQSSHKGCITIGLTNGSRYPVRCTMKQWEKILKGFSIQIIEPNNFDKYE